MGLASGLVPAARARPRPRRRRPPQRGSPRRAGRTTATRSSRRSATAAMSWSSGTRSAGSRRRSCARASRSSSLVLVAAMIPSPGRALRRLVERTPATKATGVRRRLLPRRPPGAGGRGDAPRAGRGRLKALQQPWPLEAWPDTPTRYLLCRDDRMFPAAWARRHARERLGIEPDEMRRRPLRQPQPPARAGSTARRIRRDRSISRRSPEEADVSRPAAAACPATAYSPSRAERSRDAAASHGLRNPSPDVCDWT